MSVMLLLTVGCTTLPGRKVEGLVWPPPPETPRIKYIEEWRDTYAFGKQSAVLDALMGPEPMARLKRANGIVADLAGNIYVADSEFKVIFVFDKEKRKVRFLGRGLLKTPTILAIDNSRDMLFVSDAGIGSVIGLNKETGREMMVIGIREGLERPAGLSFDENTGRLYVADAKKHVITAYDSNGKKLFSFGGKGTAKGEFITPTYLAFKHGKLYVVDGYNHRVQIFDAEGKFLKTIGEHGSNPGGFARPNGIDVDSEGHIYIADSALNNFQIFNEAGRLLMWVGKFGGQPGMFKGPTGLFIDRNDRIYVSDTFNSRVQVFQYLKERP